jgi:peptide/nickel transport system substrate-binding protein
LEESRDPVEQLVEEYRGGSVTRREFVQRGAALGLAMPVLTGLLAEAAEAAGKAIDRSLPKAGGTLKEGYDLDFSRMDPVNTTWYDPGFYALYQSIVNKDSKGRIVPDIAKSWKFSRDGKTVTFKLRSGLKFHSGRPLDAHAIKEVYDAIADPKTGSPLRSLWVPHIKQTLAPNPTTIVLKLSHPY